MWVTGGKLSAPQADDILVDTGPLSAGLITFRFFTWTNDGPLLMVEHRNALNNATLHDQLYEPGAAAQSGGFQITISLLLLLNERLRVRNTIGIGGDVQCSIFTDA